MPRGPLPVCVKCRRPMTYIGSKKAFVCAKCDEAKLVKRMECTTARARI